MEKTTWIHTYSIDKTKIKATVQYQLWFQSIWFPRHFASATVTRRIEFFVGLATWSISTLFCPQVLLDGHSDPVFGTSKSGRSEELKREIYKAWTIISIVNTNLMNLEIQKWDCGQWGCKSSSWNDKASHLHGFVHLLLCLSPKSRWVNSTGFNGDSSTNVKKKITKATTTNTTTTTYHNILQQQIRLLIDYNRLLYITSSWLSNFTNFHRLKNAYQTLVQLGNPNTLSLQFHLVSPWLHHQGQDANLEDTKWSKKNSL